MILCFKLGTGVLKRLYLRVTSSVFCQGHTLSPFVPKIADVTIKSIQMHLVVHKFSAIYENGMIDEQQLVQIALLTIHWLVIWHQLLAGLGSVDQAVFISVSMAALSQKTLTSNVKDSLACHCRKRHQESLSKVLKLFCFLIRLLTKPKSLLACHCCGPGSIPDTCMWWDSGHLS